MERIRLVTVGEASDRTDHSISDLAVGLESALTRAQSVLDVEQILETVKQAYQGSLSIDQKLHLNRIRQRVYDRRKVLRRVEPVNEKPIFEEQVSMAIPSVTTITKQPHLEDGSSSPTKFVDGVWNALKSIDGEQVTRKFPAFLLFATIAGIATWLL